MGAMARRVGCLVLFLGGLVAEAAEPSAAEDGAGQEQMVAAAVDWIARHQMPDGRWSLDKFSTRCKGEPCTGPGEGEQNKGDMAATAMGVLPLLEAGHTPRSQGPYQAAVRDGLAFLMKQQKADGDLRGGGTMYSHGFAALALCEAYARTHDKQLGAAAQKALDFIQSAQHKPSGGWRYLPDQSGDTSILGWQVSSLYRGQKAGLNVSAECLAGARRYLKSAAVDGTSGRFAYIPSGQPTPSMTAVGLLCSQFLGTRADEPQIVSGVKILRKNLPDASGYRNTYYWFYATQVLNNVGGPDWDEWHRVLCRTLSKTQVRDGCAAGSWDPGKPVRETWGQPGGRLMVTSLSALMLQVGNRPRTAPFGAEARKPATETDIAIQGRITFQGMPVASGQITFQPSGQGKPVVLTTGEAGNFSGRLKAGEYQVGIRLTVNGREVIPAKYRLGPSPLRVEVSSRGPNVFNFDLK